MKRPEQRGHWYLLTGLLLGLGFGLLYAWFINPVQYIDTQPISLAADYKDEYRKVIALAYQANQDIGRASKRAELIDPDNPSRALAALAQRLLASNLAPREARALAVLAADLGKQAAGASAVSTSPSTTVVAGDASLTTDTPAGQNTTPTSTPDLAQAIQTATLPLPSATPTITLTPVPTFTPRPTATPPSVQDAVFKLVKREDSCPPDGRPGLLKLQVNDAKGQPLAGVRITVTWEEGEESFYTGLFPEVNLGYADFEMQPGIVYAVMVGETNEKIQEIQASSSCGLQLVFSQ